MSRDIQSTLGTPPDLGKNVSYDSNIICNHYVVRYMYIIQTMVGQSKLKKTG